MAPKLPFLVPQPFDKSPYVSLTDGRKLAFYSHTNGLLSTDGLRGEAAAAARRRQYELTADSSDNNNKGKNPKKVAGLLTNANATNANISNSVVSAFGGGGGKSAATPRTPRTARTGRTPRSIGTGPPHIFVLF